MGLCSGKKRQHKHHDSPSEASCPAVAAEMEDAVDGVLEDGVPSGGEEAKESQKLADNSEYHSLVNSYKLHGYGSIQVPAALRSPVPSELRYPPL